MSNGTKRKLYCLFAGRKLRTSCCLDDMYSFYASFRVLLKQVHLRHSFKVLRSYNRRGGGGGGGGER